MSRLFPETYATPDWPRKVKQAFDALLGRVATLEAGGAVYGAVRTITATSSVAVGDYAIFADATSGAITVNLPAVAASSGRQLEVKKVDASGNAVTLDGNSSETIDGATTLAIATQYQSYTVHCDGTAWWVI